MKIQNFAVIFIVIIMPIALVLSVYTGNLIDVANRQASYDSILLNSTFDAVRAYQMNTLNNDYEAVTNSKVRDINSSVNSFFNSLASGLSSSGLTKRELTDYIPALLYTLYDGYYIYGTYDNVVDTSGDVSYRESADVSNKQYGLKPYIYYSCEYAGKDANGNNYDLVINYTLDNYITVTGTYKENNIDQYISKSGYYINWNNIIVQQQSSGVAAKFDDKKVTLTNGTDDTDDDIVILPEKLGEYLTTIDMYRESATNASYNYTLINNNGTPRYYNYIIYNNVKYYLDVEHIGTPATREGSANLSFNMTYDGIPIFYLDEDSRTYISRSTFNELKQYLGVDNDADMFSADAKFKDVNAYYHYFRAVKFSREVSTILSQIDLGTATVTDSSGKTSTVISSNLSYNNSGNLVFYDDSGKECTPSNTNNVIKTDTYHTRYTYENGVESHVKSNYDNSKIFDLSDPDNNPELASSSFNRHRTDVIISSIESSLISTIANFRSYLGGNYEYRMPVLNEIEWDRICNNVTIASFMQGLTIGNYKYYSSYSIVANTKVKDYISKESIYVQPATNNEYAESQIYHNPRCSTFNNEMNTSSNNLVGYRNIDYDGKTCTMLNIDGSSGDNYHYYLHQGTAGYECVVGQNSNSLTTDELISGVIDANAHVNTSETLSINKEVRRAYITALARERGNSYKTYGFLNTELQEKRSLMTGIAAYTAHYLYQVYDGENATENYQESNLSFSSTAPIGTKNSALPINREAPKGYKISVNKPTMITNNYVDGPWERASDSSTLSSQLSTDIDLFFDVDLNQTELIYYDVEYYVWNENKGDYDYIDTDRVQKEVWVNAKKVLNVNLPETYRGAKLEETDPMGYVENNKTVGSGTIIKAYYSNK